MAKRFAFKKLFILMSSAGVLSLSQGAMAAAFQLWEQDGASIGMYHAGMAAQAADASTAFYNPAGLVRIHNQQLVVGLDPILTNFQFNGTVNVSTAGIPNTYGPQPAIAQGGNFALVPDIHYAAPISDHFVFGLSVVAPFGLKTSYGNGSDVRYVATDTSLSVVDVTPSLGIAFNDKFSAGVGLDIEYATANFNLVGGNPQLNALLGRNEDSVAENWGSDSALGYHLGFMYQPSQETRVGLAYHSKVVHDLKGDSRINGPLAQIPANQLAFLGLALAPSNDQLRTKLTLPATTSLGIFHTFNPTWDAMGTITYTQWNVLNELVLQNAAGLVPLGSPTSITATVPEHYRNTWNYSVGAQYHVNEFAILRGGIGYDQTPSSDQYRNLQLPDSDRIAVALGGHYQATKTLGLDFGWSHYFVMNTRINNLSQTVGAQTTVTNGTVNASADVYGLQMTWDIV